MIHHFPLPGTYFWLQDSLPLYVSGPVITVYRPKGLK